MPITTTIAVTGANGHLGNVICRMLLEKGYSVKALYHSNPKSLEGLALTLVQGDVLNEKDLERLISGCSIVIHCAAIISINGDPTGIVFETNTRGPENVAKVSMRLGVKKLLHISSTHAVMEEPITGIYDETRPYKTTSAFSYDYSKAQGEQRLFAAVRGSDLEVMVFRPSSVVGPFDFKPSEMGKALVDFYQQKIPVLPPGGYNFVDVRDVAHSVIAAINQGKPGEIYLLSGQYYSMKGLAQVIQTVTGRPVPKWVIPFWVLKLCLPMVSIYSMVTGAAPLFTLESITALKNGHPNMDISKAARQLDHQCRNLEDTIRDYFSWLNHNQHDINHP